MTDHIRADETAEEQIPTDSELPGRTGRPDRLAARRGRTTATTGGDR